MALSKLYFMVVHRLFSGRSDTDMPNTPSSWPDWRYPRWRELGCVLSTEGWLAGRRECDGAEGLWRVGDGLYDLTSWIESHPGGPDWLEMTRGTDITEAFEAHHFGPTPAKILQTFYVRDAISPRNSPFTFKSDGFYQILKARVYEKLKDVKRGPTFHSKRLLEALAGAVMMFSVLAAMHRSLLYGTFAGVTLAFTTICSHNFFHMRDNWRMYLFNMSLLSFRNWRVSHVLSHHLLPNTHYDLEISMFEPFLRYLPTSDKSSFYTSLAPLSPIVYPFIFFAEGIKRVFGGPQASDLMGLVLPALMVVAGRAPLLDTLLLWIYIVMVASFGFGVLGLNAAHHHPDIFHYGDRPREDRDWGLHTLDATRDRVEVYGSTSLVLMTFGDHTLHHLFPTLDHAHLYALYPLLETTCKQFGIQFKLLTTVDLILGQFRQLMRNKPNLKDRTY